MNHVKAKVYYLISTGEVLTITPECQGSVEPTTKEQDMNLYEQLKTYNIDEVDFTELEYGTLANTFTNAKSYSINLETKKLEVAYYTQEELEEMKQKYEQQTQEVQSLNSKISDISEYLNQNTATIADIEDYILQKEQNKILGVV